jgi:L-2-hydroxyglutarate oxidase LhgO
MYELARAHGFPCAKTGKLVVASTRDELPGLEEVRRRALGNGVPGVEMLTRRETAALEPALSVEAALLVPTTGIVDAPSLVATLARLAEKGGASVLAGFEVTSVVPKGGVFEVTGRRRCAPPREETFEAEAVVNAAGLRCDEVGRMIDPSLDVEVVPLRGEYGRMNRRRRPGLWLSGRNIYPVPERLDLGDEQPLMVGTHLTPTFARGPDGSMVPGDRPFPARAPGRPGEALLPRADHRRHRARLRRDHGPPAERFGLDRPPRREASVVRPAPRHRLAGADLLRRDRKARPEAARRLKAISGSGSGASG